MVSVPVVVAVAPGSAAQRAGLEPGDQIQQIDGVAPRDVIEWQLLVDGESPELEIVRGGLELTVPVPKPAGEPLGAEVDAALFDRVRTCDNHCPFCFIHQLPRGLRRSLYVKDDDYRLSFLYGNFTTLTRFTEADLERVTTEGLSPLYVSIHATDPAVRTRMLRNRRGATSLRWLRALLDAGVAVHGQVVVCPGVNDGAVLDDTLCGVLERYPELETLAVVPLGVSRYNTEPDMRPHNVEEAARVVELVEHWQRVFLDVLGRRVAHAADEYYLLAGRPFPSVETYGGFDMHEDGIGMVRAFEQGFLAGGDGDAGAGIGPVRGFFASVDGAPAEGYRARRADGWAAVGLTPRQGAPVGILTGSYGAMVLGPLVARTGRDDVRVLEVENRFFGGTTGVAGLLVGEDVARVLAGQPHGHRYLLPDVCLTGGRFLDGTMPADLPRPVEVVPTDGVSLRAALGSSR
jgi:NifB/MoaA-like Fe-S oxidoreductase